MDLHLKTAKLLLVDDDEDDFFIVRNLLQKVTGSGFEIEWIAGSDEAVQVINEERHDAYLIDYRLGADSGLEMLAGLRIQERRQPFIILTGAGDSKIEQQAMQIGVADYLVKGSFDAELLSRVLRYSLQRKRLEEQRIQHLIELNRSKDEFISLASHQLRTPATVVKQYIAMVLDGYVGPMQPDQQAMLEKAYEGNELQLRIVNDLLHVAAIDAGRVNLQRSNVDVVNLLEHSIQDQQARFRQRQQQLVADLPSKPLKVGLDGLKLRMVIDNLIDNAGKYSDDGAEIRVGLADGQDTVSLYVSDDGVGISQADRAKLFQKFTRIPNRLSAEVGGSGLGLYWAQQIVELHGGRIDVDSAEGRGSTFTIVLPRT